MNNRAHVLFLGAASGLGCPQLSVVPVRPFLDLLRGLPYLVQRFI